MTGNLTASVLTPAVAQAQRLAVLSQHMLYHSHLCPGDVHRDKIQLPFYAGPADLLAWADTMTAPTAQVQGIHGLAYLYITGFLGWRTETIWCTAEDLPDLLDALGLSAEAEHTPVDLEVLRTLAASARKVRNGEATHPTSGSDVRRNP
ncbi:hypothetical protein [Crossiella sp. CA198]|uniref:hypothetical protein n=1 Tax=Crossiella sp. CA198 TaxID=3455607 RepID=UPI003F8D3817